MATQIAIIYASHDGHTQKISRTIASQLIEVGHTVALMDVADCDTTVLSSYNVLIFGAAIRYGKHLKPMLRFLKTHRRQLNGSENDKMTAFFSVNLTARKANRNTAQTSKYVKKTLRALRWQPQLVDVFAGKLDYPKYRFPEKYIIRLIMWLTQGPTDLSTVKVFTDWSRVATFADRIDNMAKKGEKGERRGGCSQ